MKVSRSRLVQTAILLAAGRGRRLMPTTKHMPKPLLSFGGRPIIFYAMDAILNAGIPSLIVVTHYHSKLIVSSVKEFYSELVEIKFCRQPTLNGTAGAVAAAAPLIQSSVSEQGFVLIAASDYAYPITYIEELCDFHFRHESEISISLRWVPQNEKVKRSQVEWDESTGIVRKITEKPRTSDVSETPAASLLYIAPRGIIKEAQTAGVSERGEREAPQVVNNMIAQGLVARGLVQGALYDL